MEENKINQIDLLYTALNKNVEERHQCSLILADMDSVKKENVWAYFKMFIRRRSVGWEEVKDDENDYEIPHELNEQIFHLVHNYYFKKIKELEEERDKKTSIWLKQYNKQNREICTNCKRYETCKEFYKRDCILRDGDICFGYEEK